MPLSLLAPIFLAGLAALAIPIFVHLTHRERDQPIRFPSLMFLEQIPFRTVKRQRIRNWLLFVLRSLAIILIVMAFARPLLDDDGGGVRSVLGAREVVVLVDRSFSMGHGGRWDRARDEARNVINGIAEDDRATLVLFDADAQVVSAGTSEQPVLTAALDAASVGSGVTRYEAVLKIAQQILEDSRQPRLELVLITDYQRSGWNNDEFVVMPEGTTVTHVNVAEASASNSAIGNVFVERGYQGGRERLAVSARIVNTGDEAVADRGVRLEVGGRLVEAVRADVPANAATTVTFQPFLVPEGTSRMTVLQDPDALPVDDRFDMVVSGSRPQSVLVVDDRGSQGRNGLFLRRALAIGNRPAFAVETRSSRALRTGDFASRAAVVLNDAPFPAGSVGAALRDYVNAGGGLFVVLGERSSPGAWSQENREMLPGVFGSAVDREDERGGTLAYVDYTHPVFEVFAGPRSGDLSAARFFRYRRSQGIDPALVLARFDDGQAALVQHRVGEGRVMVWTSTMDDFWNDLPLKPVYLPLVHELMKATVGYSESSLWATAGDVVDLAANRDVRQLLDALGADGDVEMVLESPGGEDLLWNGAEPQLFAQLGEQGYYEVHPLDGPGSVLFAVNLNPEESDLTPIDADVVRAALAPEGGGTARAGIDIELSPQDLERRQAAWWYLLAGVVVILVAETILSNRKSGALK